MENLEDSSSTMLSLPTENATEQQNSATPSESTPVQQPVGLPATAPMLGNQKFWIDRGFIL